MKVTVDNVWGTPSALHLRVTVWADDRRWRHRYDVTVPADEIHPEAVDMLFDRLFEAGERDEPLPIDWT